MEPSIQLFFFLSELNGTFVFAKELNGTYKLLLEVKTILYI